MSDAVEVEILGGPDDGQVIALPANAWDVRWPVPAEPTVTADPDPTPTIRTVTAPIRQRPDGRPYVDWNEAR